MPKLELTIDEQHIVQEAINTEIKSAKRAQNSGKTPQIREVYKQQETILQQLFNKIATAK